VALVDTPLSRAADTRKEPTSMVFVPGGTFRMGSERHYPEEAPAHNVSVDGFWIDKTPLTNRQFRNSSMRLVT
jgi:sulfatase modifying factor 1